MAQLRIQEIIGSFVELTSWKTWHWWTTCIIVQKLLMHFWGFAPQQPPFSFGRDTFRSSSLHRAQGDLSIPQPLQILENGPKPESFWETCHMWGMMDIKIRRHSLLRIISEISFHLWRTGILWWNPQNYIKKPVQQISRRGILLLDSVDCPKVRHGWEVKPNPSASW